jgi:5-methylcytosine-specific restriction enzyme subunit McrC
LPEMRTDICLISQSRKIILDCKYYPDAFQSHWGKPSLHSDHLYQLFAYLKNKEQDQNWEKCEGILLYPTVQQELDLRYEIHGHNLRVRTVNLNQNWKSLAKELKSIIGVEGHLL